MKHTISQLKEQNKELKAALQQYLNVCSKLTMPTESELIEANRVALKLMK